MLPILLLSSVLGASEAPAPEDVLALKDLLARSTAAFNQMDPKSMAQVLAPHFTVVMADQVLAKDVTDLENAAKRWLRAPDAPFSSVSFAPSVDMHAGVLAPGVVTAAGTSIDTYTLKGGKVVRCDSRWTATMVKTESGWRVQQLHLGIHPLDNPMMKEAASRVGRTGVLCGIVGLVFGVLIGWFIGRRMKQ